MLPRLTLLRPKQENIIRWSSTFQTLQMNCQLRLSLPFVAYIKVGELPLSNNKNEFVLIFVKRISDLDVVVREIQSGTISWAETRIFFDDDISKYPFVHGRLNTTASIIKIATFEAAIVTVVHSIET